MCGGEFQFHLRQRIHGGAVVLDGELSSRGLDGNRAGEQRPYRLELRRTELTNADFSSATLTGANLANANLTGADVRGATGLDLTGVSSTQNLINLDGSINGWTCPAGGPLCAQLHGREHSIKIHTGMNMGSDGTLRIVLDGNTWGSTISFDTGIPVSLGGRWT